MLSKSDLLSIDKLVAKRVREEVEAEGKNTRVEIKSDVIESRIRIQQELRELSDRIKNLEIRLNNHEKVNTKEFRTLNKRFTELFDFLDKDQLKTLNRVKEIEKHLHLPQVA